MLKIKLKSILKTTRKKKDYVQRNKDKDYNKYLKLCKREENRMTFFKHQNFKTVNFIPSENTSQK